MKALLDTCAHLLDKSPQPFGIARVYVDEDGKPIDFSYEYLNPAMAAMTNQTVDELKGKKVYELWGGDTTWLDYFYQAAFRDQPCEFETVSDLLEQFLNVIAFPIEPEYCGFMVQDVTTFVSDAHLSMETASAGLFFYDMRTNLVMLTQAAREICKLDTTYLDIDDFIRMLLNPDKDDPIIQQVEDFRQSRGRILYEDQIADGRWLRFSLAHTGRTDRFAYGFLEDITYAKNLEMDSRQRMEIIDSLSHENYALYLAYLDDDFIQPYRLYDLEMNALTGVSSEGLRYTDLIELYTSEYVSEVDRRRVHAELSREALISRLDTKGKEVSINFRRLFGDTQQYVELRIFLLPGPGHQAVLAARNINDEIREQYRQKEVLQNALDLAEHASRAKSTFLTNMSHDFRTPLNSIMGFATIALDQLDDTERVRNYLEKILISSRHLTNLVNDILDVSRIESGKTHLNEDFIDLYEFGKNTLSFFYDQASQNGLELTVDTSGVTHNLVKGDRMRLNQILVNTVGNALKFTPYGGKVQVTISENPKPPTGYGSYVLSVKDTGRGMTPEFKDRLFQPFERDESVQTNLVEGTGLGMTITKNLVNLMGGTIEVESELNKGSEFIITIPLKLAEGSSTPVKTKKERKNSERHFDGRRVLIVDDDELSREIVKEVLSQYGILVEEADDGDTAVEMVVASPVNYYDMIIMDMRMPRMSGDAASRAIRSLVREDTPRIPIIAATADAFEEAYRRTRDAGMTAHLTKPISIDKLIDVLDEYLPDQE